MAVDPDAQLATMLANIPDKTGRPLQEWTELLSSQGLEKHGQILKYLKGEHAVIHGFANLIATTFLASLRNRIWLKLNIRAQSHHFVPYTIILLSLRNLWAVMLLLRRRNLVSACAALSNLLWSHRRLKQELTLG